MTVLSLVEQDASLAQLLIGDLPYIRAEVVYGCRYEMAMTLADVLARRMRIVLEDRQRGLGVVEDVAALMAKELNWSPEQQASQVETYRAAMEEQLAEEKMVELPPMTQRE
jgi:glycerol-3-phosphate dehydrogenase